MNIREHLTEKGLCIVCFERASDGDFRCEEHRFHPKLLDAVLRLELEGCITNKSSRPNKCSVETHSLFRQSSYSICPYCNENLYDSESIGKET